MITSIVTHIKEIRVLSKIALNISPSSGIMLICISIVNFMSPSAEALESTTLTSLNEEESVFLNLSTSSNDVVVPFISIFFHLH